jgi:hypothetical protein
MCLSSAPQWQSPSPLTLFFDDELLFVPWAGRSRWAGNIQW